MPRTACARPWPSALPNASVPRGIDTNLDFYRSFQLYQREPTEALLSLCVVDHAVVDKPATDSAPEQLINDDEASYFIHLLVVGANPEELDVESVVDDEAIDLVGEYGHCEEYAR